MADRSRLWQVSGVVLALLVAIFLPPLGIALGLVLLVVAGWPPRTPWLVVAALTIVVLAVALLLFGLPAAPTGGLIDPY